MAKKDPRIDAYIAAAADFAKPILKHFRKLVHDTCPDAEEKIKWSFPHFDYGGSPMCSMAAFKQHCAIGFWKAALMKDAAELKDGNKEAMGHFGRITTLKDLPSDKKIIANIKEAMKLNDEGIKLVKKAAPKKDAPIPAELLKALGKNKKAKVTFDEFAPSHRREYIEWINDAKTEVTREKRIATTIEWLIEGKSRNWKYK